MENFELGQEESEEISYYLENGSFLDEDNEAIEEAISSYSEVDSEEMLEVDFGGNDDKAIQYYADMMSQEDKDNI